jgi:hypothetical protein
MAVVTWRQIIRASSVVIIPSIGSTMIIPKVGGGYTVVPPTPTRVIDMRKPPIVVRTANGVIIIPQTPPDRVTVEPVTYGGEEVTYA